MREKNIPPNLLDAVTIVENVVTILKSSVYRIYRRHRSIHLTSLLRGYQGVNTVQYFIGTGFIIMDVLPFNRKKFRRYSLCSQDLNTGSPSMMGNGISI
jgi:hypothetical protein